MSAPFSPSYVAPARSQTHNNNKGKWSNHTIVSSIKRRESGLVAGSSLQTAATFSVHHGHLSRSTSLAAAEWGIVHFPALTGT
jgi:hypothetical protein